MITAEIKFKEEDAEMILKVISKLGGKIKVLNKDQSVKAATVKEKFKADLEQAFRDIKLHQEGKIKLKTARELLDEL